MGAAGSIPSSLNEVEAQELCGKHWDKALFDLCKDEQGNVTATDVDSMAVRRKAKDPKSSDFNEETCKMLVEVAATGNLAEVSSICHRCDGRNLEWDSILLRT